MESMWKKEVKEHVDIVGYETTAVQVNVNIRLRYFISENRKVKS